MSHSGNSSSRRLKSLQKLHGGKEGEQFYNPSVFRYKCFGYLHLNSQDKGSYGTCRGFQSRMERVANMVPDTREGAIKKFLDASSDLGSYVDSDDSSDQKVKEIYTARTMIYKEDEKWTEKEPRIQPAKSTSLTEEDLIQNTEWSCFGSTSVHYLVLEPIPRMRRMSKLPVRQASDVSKAQEKRADDMRDKLTKELRNLNENFDKNFEKKSSDEGKDNLGKRKTNAKEVVEAMVKKQAKVASKAPKSDNGKVSAITPENIGLSIRKIDSSVGHFTVTDIGSLRICVESSGSLIGESSSNKSTDAKNSQQVDDKNSDQGSQGQTGETPEERKKTMDLKQFYNFTCKTAQMMQYNVKEIREAVRDDFPGRAYKFGTKVVNRFQKTSEQTFTYMGKILNSWWKSSRS